MMDFIRQPWPWYVTGPLIGLLVPLLLITGNKTFGVSSSLRHICAACIPARIPFFRYDWKKERWNLFFAAGILLGGLAVFLFLQDPNPLQVNPRLAAELGRYGLTDYSAQVPRQLFSWQDLLTGKGWLLLAGGGFLVGFGTRYAGGCTSGHAIMGLSNLQFPSLVATISFMAGGFLMANGILPFLLK